MVSIKSIMASPKFPFKRFRLDKDTIFYMEPLIANFKQLCQLLKQFQCFYVQYQSAAVLCLKFTLFNLLKIKILQSNKKHPCGLLYLLHSTLRKIGLVIVIDSFQRCCYVFISLICIKMPMMSNSDIDIPPIPLKFVHSIF